VRKGFVTMGEIFDFALLHTSTSIPNKEMKAEVNEKEEKKKKIIFLVI